MNTSSHISLLCRSYRCVALAYQKSFMKLQPTESFMRTKSFYESSFGTSKRFYWKLSSIDYKQLYEDERLTTDSLRTKLMKSEVLRIRSEEECTKERLRSDGLLGELKVCKSNLENARNELVASNGMIVLRTHIEVIEALYLACYPMPTSLEQFKTHLADRKLKMENYEDVAQAINKELNATIHWPNNFDADMKDVVSKKINKHFRTWMWILHMCDTKEIIQMREAVRYELNGIWNLASGIAGIYIYASIEIHTMKKYSKAEIEQYVVQPMRSSLVKEAARVLIQATWV